MVGTPQIFVNGSNDIPFIQIPRPEDLGDGADVLPPRKPSRIWEHV